MTHKTTETAAALEQARESLAKLPILGPALWLYARDPVKKFMFLGDLDWAVLAPIVLDQCRLYTQSGLPYAFVTWAFVNDQVDARLRSSAPRIAPHEWKCGEHQAGLGEEERAGRAGQLAAPPTGARQTFRPVALDLDGDGIDLTDLAHGVAFDVDDSGYLKQTAWIKGDDALLVLDRDYNGQFDSGRELFSNGAVALGRRGLAGLAWIDADADGCLTADDRAWAESANRARWTLAA